MKKLIITAMLLGTFATALQIPAQAYNMTAEEAYKLEQMKKQKEMDDYYKAMSILNNAGRTSSKTTSSSTTSAKDAAKINSQQEEIDRLNDELAKQKAANEQAQAELNAKPSTKIINGLFSIGNDVLQRQGW